jgi:hypothetical protein
MSGEKGQTIKGRLSQQWHNRNLPSRTISEGHANLVSVIVVFTLDNQKFNECFVSLLL